jgi:guanosine-3',5'-bis(diphosphate) 3'-pyrophosphohydrolase
MPGSLDLPSRLLSSDLCQLLETYLEPDQVKAIYRAYLFSAEAHDGQLRLTGEPYVFHPLAVAYILGQMRMDSQTLCAALLHDVIEDTKIAKKQLIDEFGEKIAELVDGVSKLSSIQFATREQAQAASFQKMLLAMNQDIRVIIIKLADRLHNMYTLRAMKPASQRRIAHETLEVYAPIANRLGMNAMRLKLEELCFVTLYPWRYQVLKERLQKSRNKRLEILDSIQALFEQHLRKHNLNAQVVNREKHYYGLYCKMQEYKSASSLDKRKSFVRATNLCAFRIIVDTVDACYRALGIVHSLYKPLCERFRDYIAIPKINGYQSLHTILFSPHGFLIEVQIRTTDMHELSETGITAYGFYQLDKQPTNSPKQPSQLAHQRATEWLQSLIEMSKNAGGDSVEFFNQVKMDLFPDEVYVFTPKGKILQLPKGATAIDFAYAIHSDVGNRCIAAKIDNQYVSSLSIPLVSGQTVEVITTPWARPNRSWLNFAVSARARSHIRHFLKTLEHNDAVSLGKRLLEKELANHSLSLEHLTEEQRSQWLRNLKVESLDKLLADIGLGNRMALIVAAQLNLTLEVSLKSVPPVNGNQYKPLIIRGTAGILVTLSRCCCPIPGDEIIGFMSAGRGLIIHQAICKHVAEYQFHHPDKILSVIWEPNLEEDEFLVDIHVDVPDKKGVLAIVSAALANMGSNIKQVANENHEGISSVLKFCISVRNRDHLAAIIRHLRRLEVVNRIQRGR